MSASPEPAPQKPARPHAPAASPGRWRTAVIGAVAALAIGVGLTAGSFLLLTRTPDVGGASAYVPADAAFYLELRVRPSVAQDQALRELLGRFPAIDGLDLSRPLFDQLGELMDEALANDGAELSWTDDVATWFDGHLAFALVEMPASAFDPMSGFDPMTPPELPSMVMFAGVTDAEAARSAFERLIAETATQPTAFTTTEHRGVTIHVNEEAEGGAWGLTDDQLLLAPAAADIVAALDARDAGGTMAEQEAITSLTDALPDDWLGFGYYDFTDAMTAALEASGGVSSGSAASVAALLEHQPLRGAMAVAATADGLAFDSVSEAPSGPFTVPNAERGLAASVPADVLWFSEGGNLGPALAAVIASIKETATVEPEAADGIATAEAALGADLEELVSWIGDGAMAIGWDGLEPYGGLVLVADDPAAAERRLGQLATFARLATMDPASGISVTDHDVAGVSVTTIRWEDSGGMLIPSAEPVAVVLEYALDGDRALVGFGDSFVARALDLREADSLAGSERYADAVAGVGGPDGAGTAWLDLEGIRDAVEQAFAAETGDPSYRDEIRPWLLPFDHFVGVARIEDGVLVQRSVLVIR